MSNTYHNCGFCVTHSLSDAYLIGKKSLQHRGREAAGIFAKGKNRIDIITWQGTVDRFELIDLYKMFPSHDYHTYGVHVRYATQGRKDKILEDAHPHVIGGKLEDRGNHRIILDCEMAIIHNGQVNEIYLKDIDRSLLKTGCDTEAILHLYKKIGEHNILKQIPGSYTLAIADKNRDETIVLRDRTGIKPGVLGWIDGKYVTASEDVAFGKSDEKKFIEDLDFGSIYHLYPDGSYTKEKVVEAHPQYCFFEWNYIANHESVLNGISVRKVRELLGEKLAEEFKTNDADLVTFLPRCPEIAAETYAKKTNLPFEPIFYKMRGERAFLGSTPDDREQSIKKNLHLLPKIKNSLKDKTIMLIDDSEVRGNNSRRARYLLYEEAKIKKAYHVNYTPQIGIIGQDGTERGCVFGVDMPPNDDFIARDLVLNRNRTLEEISNIVKMPTHYISLDGMLEVFNKSGLPKENLCYYCVGGSHPFKDL